MLFNLYTVRSEHWSGGSLTLVGVPENQIPGMVSDLLEELHNGELDNFTIALTEDKLPKTI